MKKDTTKVRLGPRSAFCLHFHDFHAVSSAKHARRHRQRILIGSCSALEGPSHFLGTETVAGAKAYFAMINDSGGVDGRKLRLLAYDDSYDPAKTEACFNRLLEQKVFALGFSWALPLP